MGLQNFPVLSIAPDNAVQTLNVSAVGNVAIPTMERGTLPKYVYICAYGGLATDVVFVTPKTSAADGASATGFPLPIQSNSGVILNVSGYSHIGFDRTGGNTADFTIVALEDF